MRLRLRHRRIRFHGGRKPRRTDRIFRAGAKAVLLAAAHHLRVQPVTGLDDQRAYALGRIKLMPGNR